MFLLQEEAAKERVEDNALSEAASEIKEVRVPYVPAESENDLQPAASESKFPLNIMELGSKLLLLY